MTRVGLGGGGRWWREQPVGPLLSLSLRVWGCTYSAHPRELGVQPSEQGPPAGAGCTVDGGRWAEWRAPKNAW